MIYPLFESNNIGAEIHFSFYDQIIDKRFAVFQMCNLNEISATACLNDKGKLNKQKFLDLCRKGSILGTLQAGYTDFPYLGKETEDIIKGEALLGVSITGWMDNPELLEDVELLKRGAEIVKETNREVASVICINPAARSTTIKPSGNASVILQTPSGIHPEHSKRYFRVMQLNKESEVAKYLEVNMPELLEESFWSATKSDYVVYIPCENNEGVITKDQMKGVKHLEIVKRIQNSWVLNGKNEELCYDKMSCHNVSNTIIVDDMAEISRYLLDNVDSFTGVSFITDNGDKDYIQAPFTSVKNLEELVSEYGVGALFMSGLIVDGLHYFNNNLWNAVDYVKNPTRPIIYETSDEYVLRKNWIKRVKKYAKNYFNNNIDKTIYCMKDIHLYHKWNGINRKFASVDFGKILSKPKYNDISDYASIACSGGSCEII
jgi:ribonucleoside-diphosphate reductase alpha chain